MTEKGKSDFNSFDRRLTLLFLMPPMIWLLHLSVSYSLVPTSCVLSSKVMLYAVTAVAVVATLVMTFRSWHHARLAGSGSTDHGETHDTRIRFMAFGSLVYGAFFTMLIIANGIPVLILRSCD